MSGEHPGPTAAGPGNDDDMAAVQRLQAAHRRIRNELGKVIIGQDRVIEELLIALFAGGHVILEGVPTLGGEVAIGQAAQFIGGIAEHLTEEIVKLYDPPIHGHLRESVAHGFVQLAITRLGPDQRLLGSFLLGNIEGIVQEEIL